MKKATVHNVPHRQSDYDWVGDWQGPGVGKYVIRYNDEELEPGDVIDSLRSYEDLVEQVSKAMRPR